MVYQLVYVSRAVSKFNTRSLEQLMYISRRNNLEFNITGLLVYCNGHFMQLLEGDKSFVTRVYDIIKADVRHESVEIITERMSRERLAERWSMGLYTPNKKSLKYSEMRYFELEDVEAFRNEDPNLLWKLLYRFVKVMKDN